MFNKFLNPSRHNNYSLDWRQIVHKFHLGWILMRKFRRNLVDDNTNYGTNTYYCHTRVTAMARLAGPAAASAAMTSSSIELTRMRSGQCDDSSCHSSAANWRTSTAICTQMPAQSISLSVLTNPRTTFSSFPLQPSPLCRRPGYLSRRIRYPLHRHTPARLAGLPQPPRRPVTGPVVPRRGLLADRRHRINFAELCRHNRVEVGRRQKQRQRLNVDGVVTYTSISTAPGWAYPLRRTGWMPTPSAQLSVERCSITTTDASKNSSLNVTLSKPTQFFSKRT